jgi:dipeptidyl aminopeptidase/acylaminoacyl peptidase
MAQGENDPTVPVEQTVRLQNALDLDGVPNQLVLVSNAKHGFNRQQWDELYGKIFAFLKAHGIEGARTPDAVARK